MQKSMMDVTNLEEKTGSLADALIGADVFVGVSAPNIVSADMVKSMIGLSDESLQGMISELPKDLFAIVATQVDTKELAKFLMSDCQNVIEKLGTRF